MKKWVLLAALAATTPAFATTTISNAGFENPGIQSLYGANANIGGWTATGLAHNAVYVLDNGYTESSLTFDSHSGNAFVDLTGAGNAGLGSGVFQNVQTNAGANYTLSFWLGNATGYADGATGNSAVYAAPSALNLLVNGTNVGTFTNSQVTFNGVNWQRFSVNFTATGPSTRIQFQNATTNDNFVGLDDVAVAGVPEPATWAMMLAGFGFIGAAVRRRSRPAAALA